MSIFKRALRVNSKNEAQVDEQTNFSTSTISKSILESKKTKETISLENIDKPQYETKWIEAKDNPFNMDIFDCREYAMNTVFSTLNNDLLASFLELRKSNGQEYAGQLPANGIKCKVAFSYDTKGKQIPNGIVFKARTMEQKWDIYKYADYLFFVKSCTGELIYITNYIPTKKGFNVDLVVLDENKIDSNDSLFEFKVVEYLIHSHVLGYKAPHPLPKRLDNNPDTILEYSFSMFGNRGFYGFYE